MILLDGIPIKEWNLAHLRERIGVVNQEPTLFGVSVADNIAFGKPLSSGPATRDEIEAAARAANVHDFLVSLPDGYDTVVGSSVSCPAVPAANDHVQQARVLLFACSPSWPFSKHSICMLPADRSAAF